MKKLLLLLMFIPLLSFSQKTVEIDLSSKEYKKINKKLDLKITNRGYDGSGKIWISDDFSESGGEIGGKYYKFLWEEAFFEMNIDLGEITSETSTERIIDADWIIKFTGGYSGEILDFKNNKKVVTTFKAQENMHIYQYSGKRAEEFKAYVKVVMNEILKTIK